MSAPVAVPARRVLPVATVVLGVWVILVARFVVLGSDLMWVVALGDVVRSGRLPRGIPFAAAQQVGWHNPYVLAELLLSSVHALGQAGLASLQLLLVVGTLVVLLVEGRRLGAGEARIAAVVSLVVVGTSAHLVITRLPSLSLVPFVVVLAVLRRQHFRPTAGLWGLVPLYVVWGNLHGGVLVGLAVLGVFLVASPGGGPILRRVGVGVGCALGLVLTSAGLGTPAYYVAALGNEAAARHTDLWARPSLAHPLDLAMVVTGVLLLVLAARARPPLWEWVATAGLVAGTLSAGRNGVWLLLFLAPMAMRRRSGGSTDAPAPGRLAPRAVGAVVAAVVVIGVGVVLGTRGSAVQPPGSGAVAAVREAAGGRTVLADEPLAETLAQQGVRVWAANPIDAFPREVQGRFLDFLHDGTVPDDGAIALVVVSEELAPAVARDGRWRETGRAGGFVLFGPSG